MWSISAGLLVYDYAERRRMSWAFLCRAQLRLSPHHAVFAYPEGWTVNEGRALAIGFASTPARHEVA